jgi:hypothetical protein
MARDTSALLLLRFGYITATGFVPDMTLNVQQLRQVIGDLPAGSRETDQPSCFVACLMRNLAMTNLGR